MFYLPVSAYLNVWAALAVVRAYAEFTLNETRLIKILIKHCIGIVLRALLHVLLMSAHVTQRRAVNGVTVSELMWV